MKKFLFPLVLMLTTLNVFSQNDFIIKSNTFYNKVIQDGFVNYKWIKENPATLNELVQLIEKEALNDGFENQLDFLLNSYNILVIEQIIQNYPLSSPLDVSGFYDKTKFNIGGNSWTLDQLENEVIRPNFNDARVHFSLVCGALGCPRIFNLADHSTSLDERLNKGAKAAMNNGWFVYQEESKLMVSEIFKWFEGDFGGKNNIINYINLFSNTPYSSDLKIDYYSYDWKLNDSSMAKSGSGNMDDKPDPNESFNLQTFTGGSLLKNGQADITMFNTVYTQTKVNWMGTQFNDFRETFVTHLLQATYGVSKSGRFNVGIDLNLKSSARRSDLRARSFTGAFDYQNNDSTRVGLSSVGLRLRFQPFKEVRNFSYQSTFLIPTTASPEGVSGAVNSADNRYFLDWDRYIWWNQFFFDETFGDFQLFTSAELLFRFKKNEGQTSAVDTPVKAFFSYFPNNKMTVYVYSEHVPRFRYDTSLSTNDAITTPANYTASGAGFKYQFSQNFNVELLYSNFWRTTNAGLGNTFNLGLKYLIL